MECADHGPNHTSGEPVPLADKSDNINFFPFLELPPELILRVCDFLDSATVINVLSKVCEFLATLASDNLIWKTRIHKRWPGKRYPPVAADDGFDWKIACIEREKEYRKWRTPFNYLRRIDLMFGFCVDVVHLTQNNHLLVGLRDHTLYNFKVDEIPVNDAPLEGDEQSQTATADNIPREPNGMHVGLLKESKIFETAAHAGWIWTICSDENKLCSGGWDSKVVLWEYSGRKMSSHRCLSAVLCSTMADTEIFAGTFNKALVQIDVRCEKPVSHTKIHPRAVLCIQRTENWIITGSESKIIHITDSRTLKICNTAKVPDGYPRSMSLQGNLMYVGGNKGSIHLFSFDEQLGRLTFIETFEESHQAEVRAIRQNLGSVLTASKDGVCKVWEPSSTPAMIYKFSLSQSNDEICTMDYRSENLVVGTVAGYVSLFRDKTKLFDDFSQTSLSRLSI